MEKLFIVVTWPEVKYFMQFPDFVNNSILIQDDPLLQEFGNSAFLVRKAWIESLKQTKIKFNYEL